jgi:aryl-alcohol dehydrogenase-like predicted oxidoreductase
MTLPTRTLGQGLGVSAIGLGCMGMSQSYGVIPDKADMIPLSSPPSSGSTATRRASRSSAAVRRRSAGTWKARSVVSERTALTSTTSIESIPVSRSRMWLARSGI